MGRLYDYARAHLATNTLFLFSSDHGAQWPFGKWNPYETSVRTPLIAAWPGVIKPGTRTDAMVSWVDLLPALVELAGGTPPPGLDGKSFAGVLRGSEIMQRDEIYTTHSGDEPHALSEPEFVETPEGAPDKTRNAINGRRGRDAKP